MLVTAKKGAKNELQETATADYWSDVGYVALGRVWHSYSHAHTRPCGYRCGGGQSGCCYTHSGGTYGDADTFADRHFRAQCNAHTNPANRHTHASAANSHTNTNPTDSHAHASPPY